MQPIMRLLVWIWPWSGVVKRHCDHFVLGKHGCQGEGINPRCSSGSRFWWVRTQVCRAEVTSGDLVLLFAHSWTLLREAQHKPSRNPSVVLLLVPGKAGDVSGAGWDGPQPQHCLCSSPAVLAEVLKLLGFQSCPRQKLKNWLQSHQKKPQGFRHVLQEIDLCLELTNMSFWLDGDNLTAVFWMWASWIWGWQHLDINLVHTHWAHHSTASSELVAGLCIAHTCTHALENCVCYMDVNVSFL